MRVAYLNADCGIPLFGDKGACVHISAMIRAMEACDAEVRVVATRIGTGAPSVSPQKVIQASQAALAVTADGGRPAKEAARIGDANAAREALIALYARWPFDVIYERYSLWSRAGLEASRALGVPLILEVNAPLLLEQQSYRALALVDVAAAIERDVFAGADTVIVVSKELAAYVISQGAAPERVAVAGNAVDPSQFHPDVNPAEIGFPAGSFVVGFTGSLKRWHGIDVMMEAFRILLQEAPNARLLIAGDGPERGWIDGFAKGARIEHAVSCTGWVDHDRLPGMVAAMDCALAPYPDIDRFYFSPLKLFEYLAAGRPIVASRIGQIADIITDGVDGLLVPPGDALALARALLAVRADQRLAGALAKAAAAEGAKHTWKRNAEQALALAGQLRKAA